jgi:transposase-like protein
MFPNDEALAKMLYLAIKGVARKWTSPIQNWASTISQLAVFFEGRVKLG